MRPKAVFAHYDGTGAASSFQPALKIVSDGGEVVAICPAPISVGAGGAADVSWFLGTGLQPASVPGAIISSYLADHNAADFTWAGPAGANVSSGYPANNTLTKVSATSALQVIAEGDFVATGSPDQIEMGLWIDGVNQINVAVFTSITSPLISVQLAKIVGLGTGVEAPLSAGSHTLDMKVSTFKGINTTFRCNHAASLSILEIAV
jgi:hypothetical protein